MHVCARTRPRAWVPPTHTYTHTHRPILIAFTQQQWFREHASLLRYTYIACIVKVCVEHVFPSLF